MGSLEDAFGTKAYLLEGRWKEIDWFDNGPNLSKYQYQPTDSAIAQTYVGEYQVEAAEGSYLTNGEEPINVKVVSKADRLEFGWSNQHMYHWYLLYPKADGSYFTKDGDVCSFVSEEGKVRSFQIQTHDGFMIQGQAL